ncbi:MAG TPA: DUF4058 family protein [Pirellulales bacterium]|nr:DUF4058 family protein [Pirellulales bacterium]
MPMHDWMQVDAGIFHDFHLAWTVELRNALNEGLLPADYYALMEQHAGRRISDLIALHRSSPEMEPSAVPPPRGGLALAEAPPQVVRSGELAPSARSLRRTLAIRHVSGHRLVAVVEIVSPGNKDRLEHVEELAGKIDGFLGAGIHAMVIDVFAPGRYDPHGIDGVVREFYSGADNTDENSPGPPPCVVSYCAALTIGVYRGPLAVGRNLPEMPLFIHPERYVNVPLEESYQAAFRGVPSFWKQALS